MFCGRVSNAAINRIQTRALRAIYNDFNSSFDELLSTGAHNTIHELNVKYLLIEVYKCLHGECPSIMNDMFNIK